MFFKIEIIKIKYGVYINKFSLTKTSLKIKKMLKSKKLILVSKQYKQ